LEIGSALGATANAVLENPNVDVTCIDNWSADIQPESGDFALPDNLQQTFEKNLKRPAQVINSDLYTVDTTQIAPVDLFFYDGPHERDATRRAVEHYANSFASTAILVFDDANWEGVVQGAGDGINNSGLNVIYSKQMLNNREDASQWWNGLYIVVVERETV
jgi:predicted O-methyltransferase YrrM